MSTCKKGHVDPRRERSGECHEYALNRSRRRRPIRPVTLHPRDLRREAPETSPEPVEADWRPTTRGDCASVLRPCPYVGCRHSLYLDVTKAGGLKLNFPELEPEDMPADESCALDVAERDGMTLEETGRLMNLTRERVRQMEERLKRHLVLHVPAMREALAELELESGKRR